MDFKTFWKESTAGFIIKQILLAIIIVVVLAWVTLLLLDKYTHHGESVTVPDLQGLYQEEARNILEPYDLYPMVIDSIYVKDKPLGTIVEQIPPANSSVKKNRSIFLILNKREAKLIPFPEVNDVSVRQAEALIKSLGLNVSNIFYRPSEFKDLVIDVTYNNQHIEAGTRLPEGSHVDLIVGSGIGHSIATVPLLIGKSLKEARIEVVASLFIIGGVNYDVTPLDDEENYVIYKQNPVAGGKISEGSHIDIWLSKDKELIEQSLKNQVEEEEFF
jgi:beta-lactam-binding protein with PASTA domain